MTAGAIDLIIYHHGSLSSPQMKYIGGDVITIESLDVDLLCFWDITNILELYLLYKYKDLLFCIISMTMIVMNVYMDLPKTKTSKMIKKLANGRKNKLHLFVDHVIVMSQ